MAVKVLELKEYQSSFFSHNVIPDAEGEKLWRNYRKQVAVEYPSFKTDGRWQLISQGWVGYIPLSPELSISLQPKVDIGNLFRMLEYAYRLKSFHFLEGLFDCGTLLDVYDRLAHVLARRVLDRERKGLYREYIPQADRLPYVRGRLDVQQAARTPWLVDLNCRYQEHTADIEENQLLAWTLFSIARSGVCKQDTLSSVRRAFRALQGVSSLHSFNPRACIGRLYNRLNADYEPMHALCRFFLEHCGPCLDSGESRMLPFLVNMSRLFELFVSEWLKQNLPQDVHLRFQETVDIDEQGALRFNIDMVIYDTLTGATQFVLDTKYKDVKAPAPDDVAQVVAYAESKGCSEAALVYPYKILEPLDVWVGRVHVRSLSFDVSGDLETCGQDFITALL